MLLFFLAFGVSALATLLIVRSSHTHARFSADHDFGGPQKFHGHPVPRIGGAGIMVAIAAGAMLAQINGLAISSSLWVLITCALPAFVTGIAEDLTKMKPATRASLGDRSARHRAGSERPPALDARAMSTMLLRSRLSDCQQD